MEKENDFKYELIKAHRDKLNMSQRDLAEKLEVSQQSVFLWEDGQVVPRFRCIRIMSVLFKINPSEFYE